MKNTFRILTAFTLVVLMSCKQNTSDSIESSESDSSFVEVNDIERVEPPNWWAGFKSDSLQLLVKHENISQYLPTINHTGVSISKVSKGDNSNNYLFIDLVIAKETPSGKFNIKKWGRIKIRQQLKQKRISDYSINKGLSLIDDDRYIEQIENLSMQKMRSMKSVSSYADKVKVYRFLSSKGYETELIRDIVDPLFDSFNG